MLSNKISKNLTATFNVSVKLLIWKSISLSEGQFIANKAMKHYQSGS